MGQANILNKDEVLKKIFIKQKAKNYIIANFEIRNKTQKKLYYCLQLMLSLVPQDLFFII